MSPLMSITRVCSETSRTSNVVAASGIVAPLGVAYGALFVVGDTHEVGQPGDLEDLAVVVRQPECLDFDPVLAGLGQEPDDQRNTGAVDVVGALEVEGDRGGAAGRGLRIGLVQSLLGGRVDVPRQVYNGQPVAPAHGCLELTRRHLRLLPGAGRARRCVRLPRP